MKVKKMMSVLMAATMGMMIVSSGSVVYAATEDNADRGDGYVIGFSQSDNGNGYRQTVEAMLRDTSAKLVEDGYLAEDLIFAEANGDISTQVQQINDFILQGVDAIVIEPGSGNALNGAIQKASDAGIPCVIVNDGPVSSEAELCYQINYNWDEITGTITKYICDLLGGEGKVIELRGMAGTESDELMHQGVVDVLADYPDIEVVSEIYTNWNGSEAQQQLASVLPTLDHVDAIITQGGDSYAAVQALLAAGYTEDDLPIVAGDCRGSFLNWWANEAPEGYDTISASANPFNPSAGLYAAIDILDGKEVPNVMIHPVGIVTKDDVDQYENVGADEVGCPTYDWDWVRSELEAQ